jgi:opacity protein-like surface antigen
MMKISLFLVVFLALCLVLPAKAQTYLGVIAGLNLANVSPDPEPEGLDLSNRTAFGFGGILDVGLNESVTLRFEPMYLQKGAEATMNGVDIEFNLAYLEVPVMLKFAFGTGDTKPYIMAGPTVGFNLSAKQTISMGGNSEEMDLKDDISSTDFGLGFGGGVNFLTGKNSIFVEVRYTLGLTNINDDSDDPDSELKTKGIQIFAGITFPIGSK